MIRLFVFIIFTCAAIFFGSMLADKQGFVHIVYGDSIIETSVNTAVVIYLVTVLLLFVLYIVVKKLLSFPGSISDIFKKRALQKKLSIQDKAFIDFSKGQFDDALNLLKRSSSVKNMSVKSLLIAAQSAFAVGQYDYTRQTLDEIQNRGKDAKLAADVVRAKLNYDVGNAKVALEYLDVVTDDIKNQYILSLFVKCYKATGDYEKLVDMTKELLKYKVISNDEAHEFYVRTYEKALNEANTVEDLDNVLKKVKRHDRKTPRFIGAYIYKLIKLGNIDKARELTLNILKTDQDEIFLESIANWEVPIPEVLVSLKKFAAKNVTASDNLALLKAMANLEFRSGLFPDALNDYNKILNIEPNADTYLKMGAILTRMKKFNEASELYNKANAILSEQNALSLQ